MVDWGLVVDLAKALAWPIVVVIGIWKVDVGGFFGRVKKLKIGENEIELNDIPKLPPPPPLALPTGIVVDATGTVSGTGIATGTPAAVLSPPIPPAPAPDPGPAAEPALVEFAPAGAIVNAWARFEEVVRREANRLEVPKADRPVGVLLLVSGLRALKVIAADIVTVAQSMMRLRNEVVHAGPDGVRVPTTEAAQRFVETIDDLIERIELGSDVIRVRQLLEQLGNPPPGIVRVGQLTSGGVGATMEGARAMAEARRGKWAARSFGGISMMISERDASVLIANGAQLVRDIESQD